MSHIRVVDARYAAKGGVETKTSISVNLIGRGYPTPRKLLRWYTLRLKIEPSNRFIRDVARQNGEAILVLGAFG